MAEYIDKGALYEKIAQLEEIARNRYLDTPSNSPAYQRYLAQMQERTALKHLIADFPAADAVSVVRCKDCIRRYDTDECPMCYLIEGKYYEYTNGNGFCDRGEWKEGAE